MSTDREETKYGADIADYDWSDPDDEDETGTRTDVKGHELDVIYHTDPGAKGGYGRSKYTAHVRYDDETGDPFVLYVVEHRWKGNYWRDITDLDWRDTPELVREAIADCLPVDHADDLDGGTRLMDEGGESRWEKYHSRRVQELSGDEMWGLSFLRDSLEHAETAAEAFDDGSRGEELAEKLVTFTRRAINSLDESTGGDE
jgi:hypothetical protein